MQLVSYRERGHNQIPAQVTESSAANSTATSQSLSIYKFFCSSLVFTSIYSDATFDGVIYVKILTIYIHIYPVYIFSPSESII